MPFTSIPLNEYTVPIMCLYIAAFGYAYMKAAGLFTVKTGKIGQ